jgi:hypothetical protein
MFFGYLIRSVQAHSDSVVCKTTAEAAHFEPGMKVLIYGQGQQQMSFPPNPRWFEYSEVAQVQEGLGRVYLTRPLLHEYDERWHDYSSGTGMGAPRIVPLTRTDFQFADELIIEGGEFLPAAHWRSTANGKLQVEGYQNVTLKNVKASAFVPTMCEVVRCENCEFDAIEIDKIIDKVEFAGGRSGELVAATGVNTLVVRSGHTIQRYLQLAARNMVFDRVEISRTADPLRIMFDTYGQWAINLIDFKNVTFNVRNRKNQFLMAQLKEVTFTIARVVERDRALIRCVDDLQSQALIQSVHEGFTYSTYDGGNSITVQRLYRDSGEYVAIEGQFLKPPREGHVFRGKLVRSIHRGNIQQSGQYAPIPFFPK